LAYLLKHCAGSTWICIAQQLTAPDERIIMKTVSAWQKDKTTLQKSPAVFLMLA
jgi:16S rRNA (cytidine1402-2'-O)-methyltransferase